MIKINLKIEKIQKNCIETAKKELSVLKEENNLLCNEQISKMIEEYKEQLSTKYSNEINKIEREYNRNLFDYEAEGNVYVNKFKSKLFINIKSKIIEELESFTKSKEYKNYLYKNIRTTLKNINGENFTIYITERDFEKFGVELSKDFAMNFSKIKNDNIGGCKIKNDKISIDNTIKIIIEEKIGQIKL